MKYDGSINLATGMSAKTKIWKNKKMQWSDLVKKLQEENQTNETYTEFKASTKEEQLHSKDVGGYVGGYLRAGRRKPENVVHRQLLTLDIDHAHLDLWEDFQLQFSNAAVLHATHSYNEDNPRYRLIMPLSREATADEYVATARSVAGLIGIELFDNTTFETNRLMFWPSSPKDIEYYCEAQDGPWVNVDEALASYLDWTDSSLWPTADKKFKEINALSKKQQDPDEKKGIVGAFCRTFSIVEVIENFLEDAYTPAMGERYTYLKGTAAAGLMVYEDKFAYSHHGTDPCSGKLCNAFDLVRIHKFGHMDTDANETRATKLRSFKAMEDFARTNKQVKKIIASENISSSRYDFAEEVEDIDPGNLEWTEGLEVDYKSKYTSSASNISIIFANDERLKGLFKRNTFDNKVYVSSTTPWRKVKTPEPIKNVDFSGVRNYLETVYGIVGNLKIEDALALEIEKMSYHPIQDYLSSLEWDREPRVDRLLIDYFGATDDIYTRAAMRKSLAGAVARVFVPGIKFDLVLTIVGKEGIGKSFFLKRLGGAWFSDTLTTVVGKEALEQIQGAWLIEIAELAGLRKAEVEAIKHFITKQEDMFRAAYGRTSETHKRQCVFFGTTNKRDFLKDPSGNRRFLPIDTCGDDITKRVFDMTDEEVDQIWAEAVHLFKAGEKLYMNKEEEGFARDEQGRHSESDERRGLIENYLEVKLPEDWEGRNIYERRDYLTDPLAAKGKTERDYICVAEIWCECLGKEKEDMDRYKTRDLNDILRSLEGWDPARSPRNFKLYGKQKYYARKLY